MEYHSINYHSPFDANHLQFILGDPNVLPLWTSKNLRLRDEEYFNFEIRDGSSDRVSDVKDNSSCTEIETNIPKSMCHICNIKVPSGYMRLHQNSDKHKIYVKISEISLERVRRQMSETFMTENINPSMYFCQSCVVLVHIKDKKLHLDSNIHKNSICIDNLLIDFSKLYSDEEIESKLENDIVSKETTQFTNKPVNNFQTSILENEKQIDTKQKDIHTLIINPNKSSLEENYKHIIDHLTTEVFKCKIKYFNRQQLIIVTEDNIKLKVNHDNFHSFSALGSKHVQCKLCGQITKNIREHMYEDGHLMKLALPIDKNCIRKIKDSKAHCILCNDLVENPEIHSLCDKVHDRLMISAMIYEQDDIITESELKTKEITSNYFFCNVCYIPVHKNDTNIHCKDPKHISNTKIDGHYLLEYSYSLRKLKCSVCFIYFPINMMEQHLSNINHLTIYETLLASNYLIKTTRIFCELCILYLEIGDEMKHIKSTGHLVLLKTKNFIPKEKTKNKKNKLTEKKANEKDGKQKKSIQPNVRTGNENDIQKEYDDLVTCKICDITMEDTEKDIKNHLHIFHQIEDVKTVIENSKMKSVGSSLLCENCCEYVPIKDKSKHLSNPTHIVKSYKKPNNEKPQPTDTIKNDDKNNNELNSTAKSKDIFFVPKKDKIDTKKQIICSICNTNVPNSVNSMQIHETGKKHNINLQAILLKNSIEVRPDHLRCTICCMDIEKKELIAHIKSDYHNCVEDKSKKSITNISYCDLCNKFITTNMERHVLSALHKSREIPKNVASFLCFVCDVLLTNSELNIREHNEGVQHKNNIKILNDNTIKVSNDKGYCETCDVTFTFKMIKQHINTSQHLILMGNDMQQ